MLFSDWYSVENERQGLCKMFGRSCKQYAESEKVPLLFDTDMEQYAQIYQHYGCER